ncbi:MAG: tail fiber domain-containing protein, partial [Flavobacterium sp.]
WSTIGNTGLSAATNFIGTTNAVDVIFRRSNVRAGRLGVSNTSFGVNALNPAVTGGFNTAIGVQALMNNESGVDNTALGYGALMVNTTGEWNTAAGRASLQANEDGNQNTAFGYQSLRNSVSGNNNTAVGRQALFNSIGNGNTGIGWRSLLNTEGDNNTALGINAGNAITTGSNNIAIGNNAQVAVAADSNQIRIGNTAITLATTQVAWTNPSDRRWKDNILPSNLGLDFINALKPVYYTRNNDEKQRTEYGFIAQELEEMLNQFGASNNGIISKDDKGMYGVRYNDLFAPIVKAIQEQQIIIANQQEEINTLKVELLTMQQQFIQRLEALENHK